VSTGWDERRARAHESHEATTTKDKRAHAIRTHCKRRAVIAAIRKRWCQRGRYDCSIEWEQDMWPFKKRAKSTRDEVPMSALSTSDAPLSQFDPRIDVEKSLERFDLDESAKEPEGYTGD